MKLSLEDPRLASVPRKFESFWPSNDGLLDEKLTAMRAGEWGQVQALRQGCLTHWDAQRIAFLKKATVAGDFLTKQLDVVATFKKTPLGGLLEGIWARANFASLKIGSLKYGQGAVVEALTQVAVPAALTAVTAVPMAGQLAGAYFAGGLKLAEFLTQGNPRLMPWQQYSKATDEELTNMVLDRYAADVDRTNLFRPPFTPGTPWKIGIHAKNKEFIGHTWAPLVNGEIPWSEGNVGALPGTMQIFGQTQVVRGGSAPAPELVRWFRLPKGHGHVIRPKGVGSRENIISWPLSVTNTGSYYPSAASAAAVLWNMAEKAGYPDMYTLHVPQLLDEWAECFEAMEESFAEAWDSPSLMWEIGSRFVGEARWILGSAMSPWIAVQLEADGPWQIGSPWQVPAQFSLITPALYKGGLPGDPAGRTSSLWIEEDLKKVAGALTWPYGTLPKQHPCSRQNSCTADLAATMIPEAVLHPASYLSASGPAPAGYRKMPWPPPEADRAKFASPFKAIIKPALERLRAQQPAALKTTLVCAYVRPVPVGDLPAYGAFRDTDLQQLCLNMREELLKHPLRFNVNLDDVEAIDPKFADALRASGVTGTWKDHTKTLGLAAQASLTNAAPPPSGEPPQGGIPFADTVIKTANGGGPLAAVAGLALAAGGYFWWKSRSKSAWNSSSVTSDWTPEPRRRRK